MNEITKYRKDGGINLISKNLNINSIVMDIGAYTGSFSKHIIERFNCNLIGVEPVTFFYNKLIQNVKPTNKIKFFNIGIGNKTQKIKLGVNGDRSGLFEQSEKSQECLIKNFYEFLNEIKITKIDLLIVNIEGAEYELLDYILNDKRHTLVDSFVIQFHKFGETKTKNRNSIRKLLEKNYKEIFSYDYVWEKWKKK